MPKRTDINSILIIGAGPIVIGQACEFDYSGTQACKALKAEGFRVILVNSNPATIMTDPELADATYIEPITPEMVEKIIGLNGYDIEVPIAEHHVVMVYTDRPGIVAAYGRAFGEAGVNIAGMQIARRSAGGQALSIITVDSPVPDEVLERVRAAIDAEELREIDIVEA